MKYKHLTRTQKTKLSMGQLNNLRGLLYQSSNLNQRWIIGRNFCSVEINLKDCKFQGVSVVRKSDIFKEDIGRNIALGKAVYQMALWLGNKLGYEKAVHFIEIPSVPTFQFDERSETPLGVTPNQAVDIRSHY